MPFGVMGFHRSRPWRGRWHRSFAGAFNGHAPKGQKCIAQRQAKRRPGYNVAVQVAPCKGKSAETERVMFTFALTGRGVMWRFTQGVASLALGYGGHWAFSPPWVDRDEQNVTRS